MLLVFGSNEDDFSLSKAARERLWRGFLEGGSRHSAAAATLPYLLRRCERERRPYRLTAMPGLGYYLEPVEGL